MGTALSERLIDADVSLIGFDIAPARCEKLKAAGMITRPAPLPERRQEIMQLAERLNLPM